jgi:hypothetical protein
MIPHITVLIIPTIYFEIYEEKGASMPHSSDAEKNSIVSALKCSFELPLKKYLPPYFFEYPSYP